MTPTSLYLSGPMANLPHFNAPAFEAAAAHLRAIGHHVVSPTEHDTEQGLELDGMTGNEPLTPKQLTDLLLWDLQQVAETDAIAVLPGWEKSRGARAEVALAAALGKPAILYLTGINTDPVLIDMTARDLHESIIADAHKRPQVVVDTVSIDIIPNLDAFTAGMEEGAGEEPAGTASITLTVDAAEVPHLQDGLVGVTVANTQLQAAAHQAITRPQTPIVGGQVAELYTKQEPKADWPPIDWARVACDVWDRFALMARTAAARARVAARAAWAAIVAAATVHARLKATQALAAERNAELERVTAYTVDLTNRLAAARKAGDTAAQAASTIAHHVAGTQGARYTEELAAKVMHGTDPHRATVATYLLGAAATIASLEENADMVEAELDSIGASFAEDLVGSPVPHRIDCATCGKTNVDAAHLLTHGN